MTHTPYQPSRSDAALEKVRDVTRPANIEDAARIWLDALGSPPRKADECITPFMFVGRCVQCDRMGLMTLVLDGFKGMVDGNILLCDYCIDRIL